MTQSPKFWLDPEEASPQTPGTNLRQLTAQIIEKVERYHRGESFVPLTPPEFLLYLLDTQKEEGKLRAVEPTALMRAFGRAPQDFSDRLRDYKEGHSLPRGWAEDLANHSEIRSTAFEQYPLEHRLYFWLKPSFTFDDAKTVTLHGLNRDKEVNGNMHKPSFADRVGAKGPGGNQP